VEAELGADDGDPPLTAVAAESSTGLDQ
jgi:hypothetical protein